MLYFKCPTCKTKLANRELYLEQELEMLINDISLNDTQKEQKRAAIIKSLNLPRYCCRQRVMTYVDLIKIIK
jgi:DNA-directed RNA polymerase subunit N (RpoN/RPB10)